MDALVQDIRRELRRHAEARYRKAQQWFFKEGITLYGVRVGTVRKIAAAYLRKMQPRNKAQVFASAQRVLALGTQEASVIAFQWAAKMNAFYTPSDFAIFSAWLKHHVRNWASCDDLATGPLGELLQQYPQLIPKTYAWRHSKNRWLRRAAAVSLIVSVRAGEQLNQVFAAADALLEDQDDLVQKGYGWTLKEASHVFPREVFDFIMRRKDRMPRTALRAALEKLPASWRRQAMKRPK